MRHPTRGDFTLLLKVGKRGGVGGRRMDESTSVWRQTSALNDEAVAGFEPIKVDPRHREALKGLRQGGAVSWNGVAEGAQQGAAPVLTGGEAGHEQATSPVFELGCPKLNRFGGITGWSGSSSGTVHKVELYVQNPHYRAGERSLLDTVRGRNKPVKDKAAITARPKLDRQNE